MKAVDCRRGRWWLLPLFLLGCVARQQGTTQPVAEIEARIAHLEKRVRALENPGQAAPGSDPPASTPSAGNLPPPSQPPSSPAPRSLYQQAHEALEAGQPEKALDLFQRFLRDDPAGPLSTNALYWVGECHFDLKNYNQAVLAFQELVQGFPTSAKTPDALLKLGRSRQRLGQTEEAREEYTRVLERYPHSAAASLAEKWLRELAEP